MTIKRTAIWLGAGVSLTIIMGALGYSDLRPATLFEHNDLVANSDRSHIELASENAHNEAADRRLELEWRMYLLASNEAERLRFVREGLEVPNSTINMKIFLEGRIIRLNQLLNAFKHD